MLCSDPRWEPADAIVGAGIEPEVSRRGDYAQERDAACCRRDVCSAIRLEAR